MFRILPVSMMIKIPWKYWTKLNQWDQGLKLNPLFSSKTHRLISKCQFQRRTNSSISLIPIWTKTTMMKQRASRTNIRPYQNGNTSTVRINWSKRITMNWSWTERCIIKENSRMISDPKWAKTPNSKWEVQISISSNSKWDHHGSRSFAKRYQEKRMDIKEVVRCRDAERI